MSKIAAVLITMAFLAGLAYLSYTEPLTPDADDCAARGKPADCWRAYEFSAPDVREEPRP